MRFTEITESNENETKEGDVNDIAAVRAVPGGQGDQVKRQFSSIAWESCRESPTTGMAD